MSPPKWTVLYNIRSAGSSWIGTGYEFFEDREVAYRRFSSIPDGDGLDLNYSGPVCATLRPFHKQDIPHLGAVHRGEVI